jgi:hypothetical protein
MNDPRYPIGKIALPVSLTAQTRATAIARIAALPNHLYDAVRGLDQAQLDTAYRDGGWTLSQVVHHIGDSHVNAYVRHKLTITEQDPPVKAYDENQWAKLADANGPIGSSLLLIQAIHDRSHLRAHGEGQDDARRPGGAVCVARRPSRWSHHAVAAQQGLVGRTSGRLLHQELPPYDVGDGGDRGTIEARE